MAACHAIYKCRNCGEKVHGSGHTHEKNMKDLLVLAAEDRLNESSVAGAILLDRHLVHECYENRTTHWPKTHGLCDLIGMERDDT